MKLTNEQKAEIKRLLSTVEDTEIVEILMEAFEAHEEKQQAIEDGLELPEIDYFGGCPECTKNDGHLNIGRSHWYVCHKHKTTWCVGANLFSAWRHESEEQWKKNAQLLMGYREVEPLHSPEYSKPPDGPLEIGLPPEFFDDDLPF